MNKKLFLMVFLLVFYISLVSATQYARPNQDVSKSGTPLWTDGGSLEVDTILWNSMDEVSQDGDTSYAIGVSGSLIFRINLTDVTDPYTNTGHIVHIYAKSVGSGAPEKVDIYLYQGTTLIATVANNWAPGRGAYADAAYTLSTTEADAITDYSNLIVQVDMDTIGSGENMRVTQIYIETPDADIIPPSVVKVSPKENKLYNSTVLFDVTAIDSSGVSSCWYSLTAGTVNYSMSQSGDSWTDINTSMTDGSHTVNFYCNDSSNNLNNTEQVNFEVNISYLTISTCQILSTPGQNYLLENDISGIVGNCFPGGANNVTINLNGYTITGDDATGYGASSGGYEGYTVQNGIILDFLYGVYQSSGSSDGNVIGVTSNSNANYGMVLVGPNHTVTNSITNSNVNYGIYVYDNADENLLNNITANLNAVGVYFRYNKNSRIENSTTNDNVNYGIYLYGANFTYIKNNTVEANAHGLVFSSTAWGYNNTAVDNYFANQDPSGDGVLFFGGQYNLIANNTIYNNGYCGIEAQSGPNYFIGNNVTGNIRGIFTTQPGADNNLIEGNYLSNTYVGVVFESDSNSNIVNDNIFYPQGTYGIIISGGGAGGYNNLTNNTLTGGTNGISVQNTYNTIINTTIINFSDFSINLGSQQNYNILRNFVIFTAVDVGTGTLNMLNSSHNTFQNGNIITNGTVAVFLNTTAINNTFLNVSYNTSKEYVENSNLARKWYMEIQVNDSSGYLEGADVNITNITSNNVFSDTTDANGQVPIQNLIEYFNNDGTRTFHTPHTVNTSKTGYETNSIEYNLSLTQNVYHFVLLGTGGAPDINYSSNIGALRFMNCSPDWEFYPTYPGGQTTIISSLNATNNGTGTGDFQIKYIGSLNTGWELFSCRIASESDPKNDATNCITLSSSFQTIWSSVTASQTKQIWLYGNCSNVSANPGVSIDMQVV
ncbi:MAG: right-handed parallel beta-helix repeat-containing protein [Nanoarchaeota archaeon]|nr:right-handed parallel beta-helix repeat-containing protein [Nanoarchaeota archaeon]